MYLRSVANGSRQNKGCKPFMVFEQGIYHAARARRVEAASFLPLKACWNGNEGKDLTAPSP